MKKISFVSRLMLNCAGADIETLRQCTSAEVTKYVLYGTCVLIPSVFAIFSGGYSAFLMTKDWKVSVLIALLWSWGIFTIDRAVVSNTRPGKFTWGVLLRVLLAVVIAITIAEPLTLRFFQDKIEQQRSELLSQKEDSVNHVLTINLNRLDSMKAMQWKKADSLNQAFIKETDGTGGSGQRGIKEIANAKLNAYTADTVRIGIEEKLRNIERDTLKARSSREILSIETAEADGLLGRLALLGMLQDKDTHIAWAVRLVSLFFFIIEVIPIFIKAGSSPEEDLYSEIKSKNAQAARDVQNNLKKKKDEIFEREQLLVLQERKSSLEMTLKKDTAVNLRRDQDFMLSEVKKAGEKKARIENSINTTIKQDAFREQLLASLQKIFDEYEKALLALAEKMATRYNDSPEKEDEGNTRDKKGEK